MGIDISRYAGSTPGPWRVANDPCHYDTASDVVAGKQGGPSGLLHEMHVVVGGTSDVKTQEANTRLIADTPLILAELIETREKLASMTHARNQLGLIAKGLNKDLADQTVEIARLKEALQELYDFDTMDLDSYRSKYGAFQSRVCAPDLHKKVLKALTFSDHEAALEELQAELNQMRDTDSLVIKLSESHKREVALEEELKLHRKASDLLIEHCNIVEIINHVHVIDAIRQARTAYHINKAISAKGDKG